MTSQTFQLTLKLPLSDLPNKFKKEIGAQSLIRWLFLSIHCKVSHAIAHVFVCVFVFIVVVLCGCFCLFWPVFTSDYANFAYFIPIQNESCQSFMPMHSF